MGKGKIFTAIILTNFILSVFILVITMLGSNAVTALSETVTTDTRPCIVIDAGHGGIDGGATSCTGVLESNLNLEIAIRLESLASLLGIKTNMIRTTDQSVHTDGNSIAARKVSDLKNRVRMVNETKNAVLVSIHQNYYSDNRYSGAQVFYAKTKGSEMLARQLQSDFVKTITPASNRKAKEATGIYLMNNINCTGVLVECGFLSNPQEENKLKNVAYQKKLCCVIAAALSRYLASITA